MVVHACCIQHLTLCFWKQIIHYLFKFPIHFPSLFLVVLVLSLMLAFFSCIK